MFNIRNFLMSAASVAVLTAPAALADEAEADPITTVVIDQVQLGDVWADMDVIVDHKTDNVISTSTAVGNTAAGLIMSGDIDYDATQTLKGNVGATNSIQGGYVDGIAIATTTAYGNASSGGTWMGDNFYRADQVSNGDVAAYTDIDLAGADIVASATTAIANVSNSSDEFGQNSAFQTQASNGSVYAETDADLCCDGTQASFVTTAAGNTVTSSGSTTTNYNGAVQTTAAGQSIRGLTDVYVGSGNNVTAVTTSAGNSALVSNEWGFATLGRQGSELFQGNDSKIDAQTYVTLDHWSGSAVSTAYGVGNSALISNVGSDTGLYAAQNNTAGVSSQASLSGQSYTGGTGLVNATAIGNAATATLCNMCGDATLQGSVTQYNSGDTYAQGSVNTPTAGTIIGSASAIGNSATYTSGGGD